jgi:hypothetical protein
LQRGHWCCQQPRQWLLLPSDLKVIWQASDAELLLLLLLLPLLLCRPACNEGSRHCDMHG